MKFGHWFKTKLEKMLRILIADKLPYLFTILLAITAYQLDHFLNSILDAPIVVYDFSKIKSTDSANFQIDSLQMEIKNLNKKLSFKNLQIDVKYLSNDQNLQFDVYRPQIIPIAPSPMLPDTMAYPWRQRFNRYEIPKLQPGGMYLATMLVKHPKSFQAFPSVYLNTDDNIMFIHPSIETFVINYQIEINIVLVVILFSGILYYAFLVSKYQPAVTDPASSNPAASNEI